MEQQFHRAALNPKRTYCSSPQRLTTGRGKIGHWDVVVSPLLHVQLKKGAPSDTRKGVVPQVVGITGSHGRRRAALQPDCRLLQSWPLSQAIATQSSTWNGRATGSLLAIDINEKISHMNDHGFSQKNERYDGLTQFLFFSALWKNQTRGGGYVETKMELPTAWRRA